MVYHTSDAQLHFSLVNNFLRERETNLALKAKVAPTSVVPQRPKKRLRVGHIERQRDVDIAARNINKQNVHHI